jgi:hypothetical protein
MNKHYGKRKKYAELVLLPQSIGAALVWNNRFVSDAHLYVCTVLFIHTMYHFSATTV